MTKPVSPIPDGYPSVIPYLLVEDAQKLLDFVQRVFGAIEGDRTTGPSGEIQHTEFRIRDSVVMLSQARGEWKAAPATLYVYVPDIDATYRRAVEAGATSLSEPADQFYGDRSGGVKDNQGITWWIGSHIEDVSPEEIQRRAAAAGKK
jgi:PhnB protein